MIRSSVDAPHPAGPTIAVWVDFAKATVTSARAYGERTLWRETSSIGGDCSFNVGRTHVGRIHVGRTLQSDRYLHGVGEIQLSKLRSDWRVRPTLSDPRISRPLTVR